MEKIRVGLIGVGNVARHHARGHLENSRAELYAVCDANETRVEERKIQWGAKKAYADYRQLLDDPNVDAVEVLTPHHLHESIGVAALQAGKHVSMQKPMAISSSECDSLIEAAKGSKQQFRVFENFHYYPPLVRAKELLDSGAIGTPVSLRMRAFQGTMRRDWEGKDWEIPYERWSWRFDRSRGGGGRITLDYGHHMFSTALWLLGDVEKVYSWITYRKIQHDWLLDSPMIAIWQHSDAGQYGSLEMVSSDDLLVQGKYLPEDEWFEITGTHGLIWVTRCTSQLVDRAPVVMYRDGVTTEFSDMDADWGASFVAGVRDFVEGILEQRTLSLTAEQGKRVFHFCRAVELSAAEGREVRLDDPRLESM